MGMRTPSFPLGRVFGVELRLHLYSATALVLLMLSAALLNVRVSRGLLLWLLLFGAVLVRETARALAAAWAGKDLQRLVLLPIGAIATYADEPTKEPRHERLMALAGPVSNFGAALTMALLVFSATAQVNLFQKHLMEPQHLLRAAIWVQILLGGVQLLPATPLDGGASVLRQFVRARGATRGAKAAAGLGQAIGWTLVLLGMVSQEIVVILVGGTVLLTAQLEGHAAEAKDAASHLTMRDVMLQEWTNLDASDTLEDALRVCHHSLQQVFPVLRGSVVVGSVARSSLLFALRTEGNGFVQGVMTRTVRAAKPDDPLVSTMQGMAVDGGLGVVVPVVEGDRMVGLVTSQHLVQSMGRLAGMLRVMERGRRRGRTNG